jgi:hypothetical protein
VTDSPAVFLNSSLPGETADAWIVFVTNVGEQATSWIPTLTCS